MRRTTGEWLPEIGVWLLVVALLVPAAVVGYVVGRSERQQTKTVIATRVEAADDLIAKAPAFSPSELAKTPGRDWITNGGSTFNQRFSSLDEIDTSNVSQLRGVWLTHLRSSALAAKYSAEAQPLEYEGIIYVPTGEDDVFAVSADTGEILWRHKGDLDQSISSVCCGWEGRGVALGAARVFIGQLDGKLVALDQKTGQVVWERRVVRRGDGMIMGAPLYFDGMVITGVSVGELGVRGRVAAYDALTGQERWRFSTIPGPGRLGQTPAVDPGLGLIYFSTGNAADDLDGSKRSGANLFTSSIVAIDVHTGKYRWQFQEVHHHIRGYDAPSPVVLFDHGGTKAIGQAGKTGWLYLLDRRTGKPLVPIRERPMPQRSFRKTAATQPFPSNDWPSSSYNPDTNMVYVCAQSRASADTSPGTLTAIDASTGRIRWQRNPVGDSCYSGTSTTHGNLVFVGHNNGELQAYDARNGNLRWHFQTGAGVSDTAAFFERLGHEYVAFHAGGNSLAGTDRGDNLWLFGLDGTIGPRPAPGTGAAVGHGGEATKSKPSSPGGRPSS